MKWLNYKGISKDRIESVEHRLQITLPDDYKQVALNMMVVILIPIILR